MGDGFGRKELREGGFCFGGSAARKAINHETDVTDTGALLRRGRGARRNGESEKGKRKGRKWWKTLFCAWEEPTK